MLRSVQAGYCMKIYHIQSVSILLEKESPILGIPFFTKGSPHSCGYGLLYRWSPCSWENGQPCQGAPFYEKISIFLGKWGPWVPTLLGSLFSGNMGTWASHFRGYPFSHDTSVTFEQAYLAFTCLLYATHHKLTNA